MREIEAQEMTTYVTWVLLVLDVFPFQTNDDLMTLPVLVFYNALNNGARQLLRASKFEGIQN